MTSICNSEKLLGNDMLQLRAMEPEDLQILYEWENDTDLWQSGSTRAPYSRYVLKRYIEESYKDIYESKQLRLMIELIDGTAVGIVDLFDFDPYNMRAEVGILVYPIYQGRGIATQAIELLKKYAFEFLNIHQLYAYVSADNEHSLALFEKCGFTISGTLKAWTKTKDGYQDTYVAQCVND